MVCHLLLRLLMVFVAVGSILILAGVVLLIWPQIAYWLSDHTNLKGARWWAQHGSPALENYPLAREAFRWALPLGLIMIGTGWIGFGLQK